MDRVAEKVTGRVGYVDGSYPSASLACNCAQVKAG